MGIAVPGCFERTTSMEDNESSYSEVEEQKSSLPFLEEEAKEDKAGQLSNVEEWWKESNVEEELTGGGKMGNKDTSEHVGDKPGSSMESMEQNLGDINNVQAMKHKDRICLLRLQRNLKELNNIARKKELEVQKQRDKLSTCQLRIKMLAKRLDYVGTEIEKEEEAGNVAALSHLWAVHRQLCTELEQEKDLELKIALTIKDDTFEMWRIETEQGKYETLHERLKKDEEELEMKYQEQAEVRIWEAKIAALQAEENQQSRAKKEKEAQKEYEEKRKKTLEDAKRNHEKAFCFLRKSMARIREKNAKEEVKTQEHMEKRIQAVLSLKTSLTSNREKLQALQAWNKAKALEAEKKEMKMREAILAEGSSVAKEIFLRKQLLKHEEEIQAFREQQKSRKIEIVSQILQEKASIHKQRKSQYCTKAIKGGCKPEDSFPWRMKTRQYIEKACKHSAGASATSFAGERSASVGEISAEIPHSMFSESGEDEEDRDKILVQPEFPGRWNQECDLHKIPQEEMDLKQLATRVMKKGISQKKKEEFPTGIFHMQIVSSREHKGCAFYSKPSCIHFKDFDVGQVYKKKIVLINASYSVSCCRLVGISEWLKDFISVHFDPPGKMSPGMSCEVVVTFKPMINKTLEGEVLFMAQTGSFAVPLKCTAKRCILALDKELIDFGSHVVGETISQTISLTNSGALGARFRVLTSAGDRHTGRPTAESAHGRTVAQNLSDSVPEKEVSNSPVNSVTEVKEQIGSNHSEEMSHYAAQVEPQRTETSLRRSSTEHLGQDPLNSRSDLHTDTAHNLVEFSPEETPAEIMLGKVTEGEIGPFSSVKLQILFVPAIPGDVRTEFVIMFDNSDCKPLCFSAVGVSMHMPVWVPNPNIDLKICMYDRLYQDCIVIQSRHSLPQDARSYFNEETRILEVPVTILIVDKAKKVNITVHAIVTTSDLEISPAQINFGYCTIYEAVQANVVLTNKSILPQEFGFVGLPEFVEIQPNDGLGILLPLESLTLDIIFKANKAKDYSFELTCKSEINRQFKLSCKAVGVHPPLELSHSLVQFAATALNSVSTATLYVMNPHASINHFTHTVPRIGNGKVAPVGPTSFEFCVPEDCPVTITPSVGTVLPGKKSLIQVSFRPTLSDQLIREEAIQRLCRAAAAGAEMQKKKKDEKRGGKKLSVFITRQQSSRQLVRDGGSKYPSSPCSSEQPKPEELMPDSEAYTAAQAFLMRTFSGRFEKYIIPCFVASGQINEKKGSENLSYSPYNTLYLELHCPAVAPSVVITSNNGKNTVDFGDVAVGHRMMKQLTIQNISPKKLELGFSVLNPSGPFLLVRAVGMLEPGENKPLMISFCPNKNKRSFETLEIRAAETNLTLSVTGCGVTPSIICSVEKVLDMGYVIAKEKVTSTFKIQNTSTLTLQYSIQLDSLSPTRDEDRQRLPSFITSSLQRTELVGTQNYNGLSVFSVFPTEGEIVTGKSQDFVVTFSPDHESLYYSDYLKVVLFGKEIAHVIHLKGVARDGPVFVEGGVPLDVPIESLAVTPPLSSQGTPKEELQEPVKSVLLALEYMDGESSPAPAVTELRIGAIQTARFAFKKHTEFAFHDLPLLQQKGFAVEPTQGTVERGQVKRIRVSWVPPADFCVSYTWCTACGGCFNRVVRETQKVILRPSAVQAFLTHVVTKGSISW
ncbi:cilia- and flagella-associated protein 74 isoform X4 [Neopsephotus bourkii]|uniref:cilia- and flagella-associated protein 74 isoform X4 n=1 Tax=Neopsephotus bourkii TaxID=309878 RepID=UPI002AA59A83|nr:cilia- and flagella-associated protein 74 isoform X4 [Neopsephotus bourkii]